jgi:hypothetical protein
MRFLLLALFLLLVPVAAHAQVSAAQADAFVEGAGLDAQAEVASGQILQLTQMQAGQLPEPLRAPYTEAFTRELSAEAIQARLRAHVAAHAAPAELEAAQAWAADPEVAAMQERERTAATDPGAQVAVQMYAMSGRLGRHEVTPERVAQVDRYLEASGASEAAVDLMVGLVVGSSQMNAALLGTEAPLEAELREGVRAQLAEPLAASARGQALYAFREVSDEELEAYVARTEEPSGQYYNRIASEAVRAAIVGGLEDAGEAFVADLRRLEASGELDLEAWRAQALQQMQQQMQGGGQ